MLNLFKKESEPEDLKTVLKHLNGLKKQFQELSGELERVKNENRLFVGKIGIVRYNPFSSGGGDQSFSISLLNKENNGIVITSLYARDGNRVYGKPIENGQSKYSLSEEEKQSIKKAIES